jgi:periplasmic divalent cation tolerance protein
MPFSLIYITHPDRETARIISSRLIDERLVACANIFPMESAYWWEGAVRQEGEFVSIVKTRNDLVEKVQQVVEQSHPYEVPCILRFEVTANQAYEKWIQEQTK